MTKQVLYLALGLVSYSAYALPDYDPFADATASGGTSYTVGSPLIGQTNAQGQGWFQAGATSTTQPTIAAGNLGVGIDDPSGNEVAFGGTGGSARFNLGTTISHTSTSTVYYSFVLQVTTLTGMSTATGGIFWAGFNNSAGTTTSTPSVFGDKLETRAVAGGFEVGIAKNSTTAGSVLFDTTDVFTTSSVIFLVAGYTFNGGNDVAQLWVNPSSTTFGDATPPTATLSDSTSAALGSDIASFILADRNAGEPNAADLDELRIGTSWADVTPEPSTIALGALGVAVIFARRLMRK